MTLDEEIKHYEEVAEKLEKQVKPYQCESVNKKLYEVNKKEWDSCLECAKEHRQLAEWLRELKECREIMEFIDSNVRVIETNDGVMIRFGGGNVCEWARRKGEHL